MPSIQEQSPTEPNTPSSSSEHETQGSSVERASFSSLINYDPSSQIAPAAPVSMIIPSTSQAEMLKLRLRVAMYKVRTNQIATPFAQLRGPVEKSVEEAVAAARERSRNEAPSGSDVSRSQHAVLKLLPAPVLLPTAYSSRLVNEDMARSPPPSSSSEEDAETPKARGGNGQRLFDRCSPTHDDRAFSSSGVKGRVAEGLLGLRHAA